MADLQYTLGLDGSAFASAASRALSMLGSLELASQLVARASSAAMAAFDNAASFERTEVAIGTITKSAEKTLQVMTDLKKLSAATPFEMSDLAPAARALLGAGTSAAMVAKQLKVLGDVSAGADTDLRGLVSVFNQVRGKGKLSAEEFQQFAERGVAGLREEIAKFKGLDLNNVGDALSKGAVSAKDLESIFARMTGTGGIFFQAMERQSQTFSGKLSTLSDVWTQLQVAFAEPINSALKPVIDDIAHFTEMLTPAFAAVGSQVGTVVTACREFLLQINAGSSGVEALAASFGELFDQVVRLAAVPFLAIASSLPSIGAALMDVLNPVGDWLFNKLAQAAHNFASLLLGGISEALAALPLGMGAASANVVGRQATLESIRGTSAGAEAEWSAKDLSAGMSSAGNHLGDALGSFNETFQAALDAALAGFNLMPPPAPAPAAPAYDGRYRDVTPTASTMKGFTLPDLQFAAPMIPALPARAAEATSSPAVDSARSQTSAENFLKQALQTVLQKLDAVVMPLNRLAVV